MSSLQRAARRTLIRQSAMRKSSFNWHDADGELVKVRERSIDEDEEYKYDDHSHMVHRHNMSAMIDQQIDMSRNPSLAIPGPQLGQFDNFFADWDMEDMTGGMGEESQARLINIVNLIKNSNNQSLHYQLQASSSYYQMSASVDFEQFLPKQELESLGTVLPPEGGYFDMETLAAATESHRSATPKNFGA